MTYRMSLTFGIENKPDIESIISASDLIPENELHIRKGTDYAKKLNYVDSEISFALVAKADSSYGRPSYTIGYLETVKVVFNDIQTRPLMVNEGMVQRSVREFTDNAVYPTYELEFISPPMNLTEFLMSRGTLSPCATPDRAAYKK